MSIGTALASGLNSYMKVGDYKQKQELRDLQKQSYSLRNEGYRLDNRFERDTFDDRASYEEGRGRKSQADADTAEISRTVAAAIAPHEIRKSVANADRAVEAVSTQQQTTRLRGNQANEAGVNAFNASQTSASDIASTNAKNWGEVRQQKQDALDDSMDSLAGILEANSWDLNTINNDGRAQGILLGVANGLGMGGEGKEATGITYAGQDEGFVVDLADGDGNVEQARMTTEQMTSLMGDTEGLKAMQEGLAQRGGADQIVAGQVGAARQNYVNEVTEANRDRATIKGARETLPVKGELESEKQRLRGRIHSLEQQKVRGFGSKDTNAPLNERIEGLEQNLEGINTSLAQFDGQYGGMLDATDEDLAEQDEGLVKTLQGQGDKWRQTLGGINAGANEATRAALADSELTQEQATSNVFGVGDSPAALSSLERKQNQAASTKADDVMVASSNATFDRVADRLQKNVDATGKDERLFAQEDLTAALASGQAALARNDMAVEYSSGSPQQQAQMEALLGLSIGTAAETGQDAGVYLDGFLADRTPAAIEAAAGFANEPLLGKLSYEDQANATDRVMDLMEHGGMNKERAQARVLQEITQSLR